MEDDILADSWKTGLLSRAVAWLNRGYKRETCIQFLIAEHYSRGYAAEVVDKAISLLNDDEDVETKQ